MKQIMCVLTVVFALLSCVPKEEKKPFDAKLYDIILSYQKDNPVPDSGKQVERNSQNGFAFIYGAKFYTQDNDTLVCIYLTPLGVNPKENSFGVYSDGTLYPTIIIDENDLAHRLIKDYRKRDLEKFTVEVFDIVDILYPVYFYKMNHGDFTLVEKFPGNQEHKKR